jgi:hypothetical protein
MIRRKELLVFALSTACFISACAKKEEKKVVTKPASAAQPAASWVSYEDQFLIFNHPPEYRVDAGEGLWMAWIGGSTLQGVLAVRMIEKGKNLDEYYGLSKKHNPTTEHSKQVNQRLPKADCIWFTYKDHRINGVEAHCYSRSGKYFESSSSFTRANARDDEKDKEYLRNFQKFLKSVEIK